LQGSLEPFRQLLAASRLVAGETVLVHAASRAAGSVVGQMCRLRGCRVVGLATGSAVCRYVVEVLGFDACIDLARSDGPQALARSCPRGVDVYIAAPDRKVPATVQALLNPGARIPRCGLLAPAGDDGRPRAARLGLLTRSILRQRITNRETRDSQGRPWAGSVTR
jgi:NADPH-dependent curcumin reductase CurA